MRSSSSGQIAGRICRVGPVCYACHVGRVRLVDVKWISWMFKRAAGTCASFSACRVPRAVLRGPCARTLRVCAVRRLLCRVPCAICRVPCAVCRLLVEHVVLTPAIKRVSRFPFASSLPKDSSRARTKTDGWCLTKPRPTPTTTSG
jgi:hypothetical protein